MKILTRKILISCLIMAFWASVVSAEDLTLQVLDPDGEEIGLLKITEKQGIEYVLLGEISKIFGGLIKYEPLRGRATVTINDKKAILTLDHRQFRVDDEEYFLSRPPISISGKVSVPLDFLTKALPHMIGNQVKLNRYYGLLQVTQTKFVKEDKVESDSGELLKSETPNFRVIIDAGHGGYDVGARSQSGMLEKDLTLRVAQRLKEMLDEKGGMDVYLTRNDDRHIMPEERVSIANNLRGQMLISLHFNWSPVENSKGFNIYVNSNRMDLGSGLNVDLFGKKVPDDTESTMMEIFLSRSKRLAREIRDELEDIGLSGQKDKEVLIAVMDGLFMPGVLLEILYLSNPNDVLIISEPNFINSLSKALCDSIVEFRNFMADKGELSTVSMRSDSQSTKR